MDSPGSTTLVLYDGVCGLCDRFVQFLLRRDHADALRFAPLQSELGTQLAARHGRDAHDLDTVCVIVHYGDPAKEQMFIRSRAVLHAVAALGGPWRALGWLRIVPTAVADLVYNIVARLRYRLFEKRTAACAVPPPGGRKKFLA